MHSIFIEEFLQSLLKKINYFELNDGMEQRCLQRLELIEKVENSRGVKLE